MTNYPSVADQICAGKTGHIVEIDPEAIADGVERLIKDDAYKAALELNCRNEQNRSIQAVEAFYRLIN